MIRSEIKARSVLMDHKGIEYLIVQAANPLLNFCPRYWIAAFPYI